MIFKHALITLLLASAVTWLSVFASLVLDNFAIFRVSFLLAWGITWSMFVHWLFRPRPRVPRMRVRR